MAEIRVLTLEDGENLQTVLFRVQKGWTIRFCLGTTMQPQNIKIFCNHPRHLDETFNRKNYFKLPWTNPYSCAADTGDRYCSVNVLKSGTFHFYVTDGNLDGEHRCDGYFVVQPTLSVQSGFIAVDQVVMQTVLSKCLGPFKEWEERLRVSKEANYNFIHFSPVQALGESNSSYSIKDHLALDDRYSDGNEKLTFDELAKFIGKLQREWNMLSVVDVVWNHAANNADWLLEHPNSAYNVINSPHLRPAFLVDRALWHFNSEIINGDWKEHGIPPMIDSDYHLERIDEMLRKFVLAPIKLEEFFILDIDKHVKHFQELLKDQKIFLNKKAKQSSDGNSLKIIQDSNYKRFGCTVDMEHALTLFGANKHETSNEEEFIEKCSAEFRSSLLHLNHQKLKFVQECLDAILYNTIGNIRYHFVDFHGPKLGLVTTLNSIVTRYFTCPWGELSVQEDEELMNTEKSACVFAHNGWVMGGDALKDFADSDSYVYLKRELIAWGDSVKLRYGTKPSDSPFLWTYMKDYTQTMARIFHGFRIDNCHSTPIPLAEYLLDAAREVNPELYVLAELFTNSEAVDNTFINRLGINSLIRERMSAHDPHDLGRHVHRFGGDPVGSFINPSTFPLTPMMAHALFMDLTHDNRSPMEVRSPFDYLASSALVAISSCGIGSNRGYDEMVPEHISVVKDNRRYQSWRTGTCDKPGTVSTDAGILRAKKIMNALHVDLVNKNYSQIYVDQVNKDVVSVTRHCPTTHESVILVAHTAFAMPQPHERPLRNKPFHCKETVPPLVIPGHLDEIIFEARLVEDPAAPQYIQDQDFITGLQNYVVELQEHVSIQKSQICRSHAGVYEPTDRQNAQEVHFINFPPGSVIVFKVSPKPKVQKAIKVLRATLSMFPKQGYSFDGPCLDSQVQPIEPIIKQLSLADLNRVLFRCNSEEVDDGMGGGVYVVPNAGPLVYCGLQGFMSMLSQLTLNNDLGHPMCDNLRQGDWMPGYMANRLKHNHGTRQLGLWLESVFWYLKELPRYLIPCYFEAIVHALYNRLIEHSFTHLSEFIQNGSTFVKLLALGSIQMCGLTNSAQLPALSSNLRKPFQEPTLPNWRIMLTMAAGLPHFSTGFMRCWGRDTFISLRGLLLIPGRFAVARNLILGFGGCLRHGLIPNLLGAGVGARYNCRDAVWWWLEAIQSFCKMAPNGHEILSDPVLRMYPNDNSPPVLKQAKEQPLYDVIQEALQRHADGIAFRERNAGQSIDRNMTWDGFNQSAGVDWETGFVFGGNKWNCGTWMDKMGESHQAGNVGHPASPRDGSAVEIVGLCKSAVRWLHEAHGLGHFPHEGVTIRRQGKETLLRYSEWDTLIKNNFEKHFWINSEPKSDNESKHIHRRGIYKDSVNSTNAYTDFQLRPNYPIAMAVAPELFDANHAWTALQMVEDVLLGPLGLATLDPRDWAHDGNYDNSQDSGIFNLAKGFNYHQGPEWVWILGPFLRAKLHFALKLGGREKFLATAKRVCEILAKHKEEISSTSWRGLPELTNAKGAFCRDGCPSQAWSLGCLLEVMYDMENMTKKVLGPVGSDVM